MRIHEDDNAAGERGDAARRRDSIADERDTAAGERETAAEERHRAAQRRNRVADERDGAVELRAGTAGERDAATEERHSAAQRRDSVADERDSVADERETAAGERHSAAQRRDSVADEREGATQRRELDYARSLLESAPDAMVIVNDDGIIQLANAETGRLFGYRRDELVGQSVEVLLPPRDHDRHPEERAAFISASAAVRWARHSNCSAAVRTVASSRSRSGSARSKPRKVS